MAPTGATPLWFGPSLRPLFGWAHQPAGGMAGTGVVLCPPLGLERTNAHYAYRMLAEDLSDRGLCAVRFDYDGTGDSAGSDRDPHRVEAWLSSIASAIDFVRKTGCTKVVLVGMRMGALLAAQTAVASLDVDGLVLWDPCTSGREFLRQERAMQLLQFAADDDHDGEREFPGWSARGEDVAAIEHLAFPQSPTLSASVGRILLLTRPTAPAAAPQAVDGIGAECGTAFGQAELLDVNANDARVPRDTISTIVDWIAAGFHSPLQPVQLEVASSAVFSEGPHHVVENLVSFGPRRLFGITTTPLAPPPSCDVPWAIFLNSAKDSHVGPCRLWVQLARHWATLGVPSVRFDLGGLGDSPSEEEDPGSVIRMARAFSEIEDVAAAVTPQNPANVILIGLCSGGYQALDSALSWKFGAPRGVYAINSRLRFTPPEMAHGPIDGRRQLCRPAHPFSQSSQGLPTGRLRRTLWWFTWCVAHPKPLRRRHWLRTLTHAGSDVWCVGGAQEIDELKTVLKVSAADQEGPEALVTTRPDLDHGLVRGRDRSWVAGQLTRRVRDRFATALSDPVPARAEHERRSVPS